MEITTNGTNLVLIGIWITVVTIVNLIIYMRKKSSDGYFDTQHWGKLSLIGMGSMLMVLGVISILWLAFEPTSFVKNIQFIAQIASINLISEVLSIGIMWIFRGRTSPLMKLQKKA